MQLAVHNNHCYVTHTPYNALLLLICFFVNQDVSVCVCVCVCVCKVDVDCCTGKTMYASTANSTKIIQ